MQLGIWEKDTGIIWLNVGDKYHWSKEDIAILHVLANRNASREEVLTALPKYSQTAISNMSLRECGRRIISKSSHRLDGYISREDIDVLEESGVSLDAIAEMRGAVRARTFSGEEYWSLA